MMPSARTRVFALLGDPVAHSLSPKMHNAAFHAAGIDAVYVALRCAANDVVPAMRLLAASGGGGNVTLPHKAVAATCAAAGSVPATLGAANTFASSDNGLVVANTDVDGIADSVGALGVPGSTWLVIGTGGSARAAVGAAARAGVRVAIMSRDAARGEAFAAWAETLGVLRGAAGAADVAINATPMGLGATDPLPVDPASLPSVRGAVDLTYRGDGVTAWCRAWHARGIPALDGRDMLLRQGVAAWHHWLPGVVPPVEVMRAVMRGAMD